MTTIKQQRTADRIQRLLSDLLRREARDPRLQALTITYVRIDRELQYADVYVNALGEESRQADVMEALASANGFLRHEVGQRLQLRVVPRLHFHWDPTLAQAAHINALLDSLEIPPAEAEAGVLDDESE